MKLLGLKFIKTGMEYSCNYKPTYPYKRIDLYTIYGGEGYCCKCFIDGITRFTISWVSYEDALLRMLNVLLIRRFKK